MSTNQEAASRNGGSEADTVPESEFTREELLGEVQLLAEENSRLRDIHKQEVQESYRRAATGFFLLGVGAVGGAFVMPAAQPVLIALAGVGLFTAVMTYWLTPERVIAAPTGERMYGAYATNGSRLIGELGLQERYLYVPAPTGGAEMSDVRLFVPQAPRFQIPDEAALESLFVVTDDDRERGLSVVPTGATLVPEFEESGTEPAETLDDLSRLLADALVEGFNLVERATAEVGPNGDSISIAVRSSALGAVDRFDHPVGSFVAVALASELDVPVRMDVQATNDSRAEYIITCRWGDAR